ncbi:hypothetical protein OAL13_00130 [bacterium]|nr:hypothetical protein [bacterium]
MNNIFKTAIGLTATVALTFGGYTGVKAVQKHSVCKAIEGQVVESLGLVDSAWAHNLRYFSLDNPTYQQYAALLDETHKAHDAAFAAKQRLTDECGTQRFAQLIKQPELQNTIVGLRNYQDVAIHRTGKTGWLTELLDGEAIVGATK